MIKRGKGKKDTERKIRVKRREKKRETSGIEGLREGERKRGERRIREEERKEK